MGNMDIKQHVAFIYPRDNPDLLNREVFCVIVLRMAMDL